MKNHPSGVFGIALCLMMAALICIGSGYITKVAAAPGDVWTFVDGNLSTGLNKDTTKNATDQALAVYGGALYVAWSEVNAASNAQIRVRKYNGTSWTWVDGGGANGLNINTTESAVNPSMIVFQDELYLIWSEIYPSSGHRLCVKKYDGAAWTDVANNSLERSMSENLGAANPTFGIRNDTLYAAWTETYGTAQLRVKRYDGGTSWTFVDGGGYTGTLNCSTSQNARSPKILTLNNVMYIVWTETTATVIKVHVKRYDGGSTWVLLDSGSGLNYAADKTSELAGLAAYNSLLHACWVEGFQVRMKSSSGTGTTWNTADGGTGLNRLPGVTGTYAYTDGTPVAISYNNKLYLTWGEEENATDSYYHQIRAASYSGTRTMFDGDGTYGLNKDTHVSGTYPTLIEYNGDLYIAWREPYPSPGPNQLRVKKTPLPAMTTSVTVAPGWYKTGQHLDLVVSFNKAVNVTGTPIIPITLNTGGTVTASYYSGSGTSTLTLRYTIIAGSADADGIAVGPNISLVGGSIRGAVDSLDAELNLNGVGSTTGVLVDGVAPTAGTFIPVNGATNILTGTNLTINFSENVAKGTGNITIKKAADNSTVEAIAVSGTNVTITGSNVVIDPTVTLDPDTSYYVLIDNTAFHDAAGNNYAGISGPTAWRFTTKDSTPPSGYSVSIDQPYINNNNKTAMSFTFAGAEVGATYNYTLSSTGGGGPLTGNGTITSATQQVTGVTTFGLNEGTLTLSVTLKDTANNTGTPATDTVVKDTLMPTGYTVHFDGPINNTNKSSASFTFAGAEIGASFYFSITSSGGGASIISSTSGWIASSSTQQVTLDFHGLNDGTLTINFKMTDVAGNTGEFVTNTGEKDTVVPGGYSVNINPTAVNGGNQTAFSFTFSGAEVGTAYDYQITSSGGGTPVAYDGLIASATQTVNGIDVSGLNDGTLTLSVILSDAAGNSGPAATDTVGKDATAPSGYSVNINQAHINNANKTALSFTFAGAEVGTTYSYNLSSSGGGSYIEGTGTITSATQTVSGVNVSGLNDGTVTLHLSLVDTAGNTGTTAADTVLKDTVAPTGYAAAIDQTSINNGNKTALSFAISGAETGASYNYSISSSGGGTAVTGSGTVASGTTKSVTDVNVAELNDGTLTVSLTMTDAAGNPGSAVTDTVLKDTVLPTITAGTLAADNAYLDITFSEGAYGSSNGVDPLNAGNLALTYNDNGSAVTISITGVRKPDSTTQAGATPLGGGETTVRVFFSLGGVPAGMETIEIKPASGNPFYDQRGNAVALTQTTGVKTLHDQLVPTLVSAARTNDTHITVVLSEPCSNLAKANNGGFTVEETGNPALTYAVTATAQGADDSHVVLTVANLAVSGREGVTVKYTAGGNGTIQDSAGNGMADDGTGVIAAPWDTAAPTVEITSTAPDPTKTSPIPVTITFSEAVTGFTAGDLTVGNGTAGGFSGNGTTYTATITPSGQGAVTVDIAGGAAEDVAGNGNAAATQFSRTYDTQGPTVAITTAAGDPTNTSPIPVTITFSEAVTGFVSADIAVTNGNRSDFSGSGTTYTVNIIPSGQGTVTVNVSAGTAQDAAGNANAAATPLSLAYDNIAPTASITTTASNPTDALSFPITITLGESVADFEAGDVTVTNGTMTGFSGGGTSYTADIAPVAAGPVTIGIAAGAFHDAAGNGNALTQLSLTFAPLASPVIGLSIAEPIAGTVHLTWTNPGSAWEKTVVIRKQGGFPLNPADGTRVYEGTAAETYDSDLPAGTYYYAVYGSYYGSYANPAWAYLTTTATSKVRWTYQPGDGGSSTLRTAQSWRGTSYTAWNGAELPLGTGASGAQSGVWLQFSDLIGSLAGQIPAGTETHIVGARLVLHIKRYEPTARLDAPYVVKIYRVPVATGLGTPCFGTADGIRTGLDWAYRDHRLGMNRPWAEGKSDIADGVLGGALDSIAFIPTICSADGCYEMSFNVTEALKAWVGEGAEPQANEGFFLVIEGGNPGDIVVFDGATAAAADRPLLEVVYSTVPTADLTGPASPVTGLTAVPGAGQIALSWTNPTDPDYAGVRVVRRIGRTPFNAYDGDLVYDGTASSHTDTGLDDGTVYYYAVFAYDTDRNHGPMAWVRAVPGTPAAPASFSAASHPGSIALAWSSVSGATSYRVYRRDGLETRQFDVLSGTSYTDNNVETKTYTYYVVGLNEHGEGQPSVEASAAPSSTVLVPNAPGTPTATVITNTAITLTWTDSATNETGYAIERSVEGGGWTSAGTVGFDTTTFIDTGLAPDTTYRYRVRAVRGAQYSAWIESEDITTTAAPLAPTNLTWTVISAGRVNLAWTDAATNETGYRVDVCDAAGTVLWSYNLLADTTTCSVTGLVPGTAYILKVSALNGGLASTVQTEIVITGADPKDDLFI